MVGDALKLLVLNNSNGITDEERFKVAATLLRAVHASTLLFFFICSTFLVSFSTKVNDKFFTSWVNFSYTYIHPFLGGVPFYTSELI